MNFIKTIKSSEFVDYLSTGSGRIEIGIKEEDKDYIKDISTSGDNSNAVEAFIMLPHIQRQLKKYSDELLKQEVYELGVEDKINDRDELEQILVWNLAWDYSER